MLLTDRLGLMAELIDEHVGLETLWRKTKDQRVYVVVYYHDKAKMELLKKTFGGLLTYRSKTNTYTLRWRHV